MKYLKNGDRFPQFFEQKLYRTKDECRKSAGLLIASEVIEMELVETEPHLMDKPEVLNNHKINSSVPYMYNICFGVFRASEMIASFTSLEEARNFYHAKRETGDIVSWYIIKGTFMCDDAEIRKIKESK